MLPILTTYGAQRAGGLLFPGNRAGRRMARAPSLMSNHSPNRDLHNDISDSSGAPLSVPFTEGTLSTRTDVLQPGQSLHDQSQANVSAPLVFGWAEASCTGEVEASMLYRLYQGTPRSRKRGGSQCNDRRATQFVTFAQTATGVAYAIQPRRQP